MAPECLQESHAVGSNDSSVYWYERMADGGLQEDGFLNVAAPKSETLAM